MDYIKVKDIMKKYGVSKTTIYNWIKEGLPSYSFGKLRRFTEKEVEEWMNKRGK